MSGTKGGTTFRTFAICKGLPVRLIKPFKLFLVVPCDLDFNQIHQRLATRLMAVYEDQYSRKTRLVDTIARTLGEKVRPVISLSVASKEKLVHDE